MKSLLIWDGDCSFCRRWITRWRNLTGDAIEYEPYQAAAERAPQVPREAFGRAVHLLEPDGRITRAAEAVFRSLALAGRKRYLLWLYERVPPFRWFAEAGYAFVARGRNWLDPIDKIVVGVETRPATYGLTRAVFLRLLGVIYLIAFVSLITQIEGLIGRNGILPFATFADAAVQQVGSQRWWMAPTLAYLGPSDRFLHALCVFGIVASSLMIVGLLPLLMSIATWAAYLSLTIASQSFLSFQWDALLLEAGFLAILWSPPLWLSVRPPKAPSYLVLLLIRWLLFRLMFLSALVKWFSGDESWRNMTALRFHFESQPLPTWTSWYAHHSPHWMLAFSCFAMFFIEGIVALAYFAPRRTRMLAFWMTVLLQVSILATGNYGFFNLLTIVLAVALLDDVAVSKVIRIRLPECPVPRPRLRAVFVGPVAIVLLALTTMAGIERLHYRVEWIEPLATLQRTTRAFMIANGYGLFEVMTKGRPEIVIEGSNDQREWKAYEFKWKPGDVTRRPAYCVPHMPRLDWLMWFEALGEGRVSPWFGNFLVRLLQNQPEVLELMKTNPFPDKPPRWVRAVVYDYRFSDPATRKSTGGAWWTTKPVRLHVPPASIQRSEPAPDFSL